MAPSNGILQRVTGLLAAKAVSGVKQVSVTAQPGKAVHIPRDSYDRLGFVIAAADTADAVTRALDQACDHINVVVTEPVLEGASG